jgi:hypothetical protein
MRLRRSHEQTQPEPEPPTLSRRVIFYHYPKSAGTSIKDTIYKLKINRAIFDSHSFHDIEKLCYNAYVDDPTKPIQYVHIHEWNPVNMFRSFIPAPTDFTFTIIREPISLFYSIYYHAFPETKESDFKEKAFDFNHEPLYRTLIGNTSNIREYIDLVLSLGSLFKDKIVPKGYYNRQFLTFLNFVGIYEDLVSSMNYVSKQIDGLPSEWSVVLLESNTKQYEKDLSYRRDELEQFFSEEIVVYTDFKQWCLTSFQQLDIHFSTTSFSSRCHIVN